MPDTVNVHDGGEAPQAANAGSNPTHAVTGAAAADRMNLSGGQAPELNTVSEAPGTPGAEASAVHAGGEMAAPPPPLGGGVHGT